MNGPLMKEEEEDEDGEGGDNDDSSVSSFVPVPSFHAAGIAAATDAIKELAKEYANQRSGSMLGEAEEEEEEEEEESEDEGLEEMEQQNVVGSKQPRRKPENVNAILKPLKPTLNDKYEETKTAVIQLQSQDEAEEAVEEDEEEDEEEDDEMNELSERCSAAIMPRVLARCMPIVEKSVNIEMPGVLKLFKIKEKAFAFAEENIAVVIAGAVLAALLVAKKQLMAGISKMTAGLKKKGKLTKKNLRKLLRNKNGKNKKSLKY